MKTFQFPFKFDAALIQKEISKFTKAAYQDVYNPSVTLETLWCKHLIEPINDANGLPVFLPNAALKNSPYLLSILETFQCKKETFRIHILDPGASIQPHRDNGYRIEDGKIRVHIPVQTNEKVQLLLDNEPVHMKAGECWYCNFHITHEVRNHSNEARIHLIIDLMVNDWLEEIIVVP
jgi:mannose-6-phosphate isomerase-like protein (cupin superfamily)